MANMKTKKKRPQAGGEETLKIDCTSAYLRMEGEQFFYGFTADCSKAQESVLVVGKFFDENGEIMGSGNVQLLPGILNTVELGAVMPKAATKLNADFQVKGKGVSGGLKDEIGFRSMQDMCVVSLKTDQSTGTENDVYSNQRGERVWDILLGVEAELSAAPGWHFKALKEYRLALYHKGLDEPLRYCMPAKRHTVERSKKDKEIKIIFPEIWKNQIPVDRFKENEADFIVEFSFTADMEYEEKAGENPACSGYRTITWDSRNLKAGHTLAVVNLKWDDDL